MNLQVFKEKLNQYTYKGIPYLFVIDFECQKPFICKLSDADKHNVYYDIKNFSNFKYTEYGDLKVNITSRPVDKCTFSLKIAEVIKQINKGNSYLLNLCFSSEIKTDFSLKSIFNISKAPYKLLFKDKFTVFSPECFIRIINNEVYTYPMKGTINANLENAEQLLLDNLKEKAEHNTIVDLMRNDLSMIASNIELNRYRYIDRITTNRNEILQTSSEIKGQLAKGWQSEFGTKLLKLLPAGSISGAPKQKTVEIIKSLETEERGYYTGVFGIFDGSNLDSAVSIRYIEKRGEKMFFKSGGGITSQSDVDSEYEELLQKIYIPI